MFGSKQINIGGTGYGSKLYKAFAESLNDKDPQFNMLVKGEHTRTMPEIGRVTLIGEAPDGKSIMIIIQPIDAEGNPLDKAREEILIPFEQKEKEIEVNTWCDDLNKITALCSKKNYQSIAGLQLLVDKAMAMKELVKRTSEAFDETLEVMPQSNDSCEKPATAGFKSTLKKEVEMSVERTAEEGLQKED